MSIVLGISSRGKTAFQRSFTTDKIDQFVKDKWRKVAILESKGLTVLS